MINELKSPWLEPSNENWLRLEIEIVKDRVDLGHFIPDKAINLLCKNKQEQRLFEALTELAPMFATAAYKGKTSIWLSPPPSFDGNDVVVIMGKDRGRLRMVGCNFCGVKLEIPKTTTPSNFWAAFDACSGDLAKYRLMSAFVSENFDDASLTQAKYVDSKCEEVATMPLYIVFIDNTEVYVWSMPCLIKPLVAPLDSGVEMVKEF